MFQFFLRHPATTLITSFLIAIVIGAFLLKLPSATYREISFLDALFTAVSAVCVTGLIVLDTGSDFTPFGQTVILLLIQFGGLGIITSASIVFLFFKKIGIGVGAELKTILEEDYASAVKRTLKFIFLSAFLLELLGAVLLFLYGQTLFNSVFHSISAFNNAGFSTFKNNLENFRGDIFINVVISFLIISGGIGILVLSDFYRKIVSFFNKQRMRFSLHSKLVLIVTVSLILAGAGLFYFFEKGNLSYLSQKELVLASFFQSITSRTAGFNTVNIGGLSMPTLLLMMFLMFIGGAPSSASGGVKVTSLALVILSIVSFFKKEEEITVFGRTIPKIQLRKIIVLIFVYLLFCLVAFLLLLYTEKGDFEKILFEVFSAMGTVGLSTGLTPLLTDWGKVLIIVTMFVGRLLPLSLVIFASRELIKPKILYPQEKIILG